MNHPAKAFAERLVGLKAWGVLIGPAGMTIDFGRERLADPNRKRGEYSVWLQCQVRLHNQKKELLFDTCYPVPEDFECLRLFINGTVVTQAWVDERNSSLRIVLSDQVLLSAYPWTKETGKSWTFFDNTDREASYCTVCVNEYEGRWPVKDERLIQMLQKKTEKQVRKSSAKKK